MSDLPRNQILRHSYPHDLDRLQQEFGPQFDDVSCGPSTVHHGLLLGGLTVPKTAAQAYFRSALIPAPTEFDYLNEDRLTAGLNGLGFSVEERHKSRAKTRSNSSNSSARNWTPGGWLLQWPVFTGRRRRVRESRTGSCWADGKTAAFGRRIPHGTRPCIA